MTGRPVAIADYVDEFDAIVEAWLPGSEGDAIADVMLDSAKDFTAACPVTWTWYPEYLNQKSDPEKVLFPRGTGLKKDGTSVKTGGQTSIPGTDQRPEEPEKQPEQKIPMYQEAIDIDANENRLEGEWCGSDSYNISTGNETVDGVNTGYAQWSKKDWGNGKWKVYFRQAGTYDVTLKMKVTEPAEGEFTNFKFGIHQEGDPNPTMVIPGRGATNGYEEFTITGLDVAESGKWTVKIMDSSKEVSAKLDYIEFTLKEAKGPKDEGTDDDGQDPADETPIESRGEVVGKDAVKVWMTSTENAQNMSWYKYPTQMKNQLSEKEALDLTTIDSQEMTTIHVDADTSFQTFLGMGTSLEESTIYNLNQLEDDVKQQFIDDLVDPQKGGMTLFRVTIATADFTAQRFYTYYDIDDIKNMPADFKPNWYPKEGETGFTIQKDRDLGIIDTIHMVQAAAKKFGVEDEVKFFASSWTPPGWMKNDDASKYGGNALKGEGERLRGGTLNDGHIEDLAMYYLRFLEEYAKEGIPVYGMTLQNEPGDEFNYPSCKITGEQEGRLAIKMKELLGNSEILRKAGIQDVKLWAFDHNCSIAENYVKALASVEGAMDAIDGIAFHDYSGDMKTMQKIYDEYLNKGNNKNQTVNLTERSVWGTKGANSIITYLRNNAISYNSWVTMLDSNIGIHQWPGTPDPTMFARAAGSSSDYWAMPEFYITGQFTRFVRPGYVRVASDEGNEASIRNVVFKNPETNELAAVVVNASKKKQNFKFVMDGQQFIGAVPAGNVATYVWKPAKNQTAEKNIVLDQTSVSIYEGLEVKLHVKQAPEGTIVWKTSNSGVAAVSNGTVKAIGKGTATITASVAGKYAECKVTVKKLAAPANVKASCAGTGSIKISWKKVAGASQYQVYRKSGKKWKKAATVKGTTYTNKKLASNKKYQFRVRAVLTSGGMNSYGDYSRTVKGTTGPKKVTGLKLKKVSGTSYQISWKKAAKAGRYDIYQKTGKGSYKKLKSVNAKTLKYTVKGLKKGKTYRFYVKAVRKSGKSRYAGSPAYTKKVKIK